MTHTPQFSPGIVSVACFGSTSRGDSDRMSDLDILVVVEDGSGRQDEGPIQAVVERQTGRKPSLSFYGEARLRRMFEAGHLFAWHLFLEASPMFGMPPIPTLFGRPSEYKNAIEDITGLTALLATVPISLEACPGNLVYEYGITFVCLRNIAISASAHVGPSLDFTRYAPYRLGEYSADFDEAVYGKAITSRLASQRGFPPPDDLSVGEIIGLCASAQAWIKHVTEEVSRRVEIQQR